MTRLTAILCGVAAAASLAVADMALAIVRAETRVALVIGNGAYQHASPLATPVADANAIAERLRAAGFGVVETRFDLGNLDFKSAARDFAAVAKTADVAIVYFAGYGIDVNGTNYLLPVDARLASDFDVEDEALSLDRLMRAIEPAKRVRAVILDASRDNAFVHGMKRSVSSGKAGLARVEPASAGTLIAFAAKPGAIVEDGQGAFTAALVKRLIAPGADLRTTLDAVRDEVIAATAGRQEPFVTGTAGSVVAAAADPAGAQPPTRQITVLPAPDAPSPPSVQAAPQTVSDAQRDFEAAERIGTREAWDAFLSVHPAGFYAALARTHRDKLPSASQPTQAPPQIAILPVPDKAGQEITRDPRAVARALQTELKRVGCDPGSTDGNWTARSRSALDQFNRRSGMDFDSAGPSVDALDAVKGQRGRICPLVCGSGQRAEGERCVAIPAAPAPSRKAAVPPPQERARKASPPPRRAPPREAIRRERIPPPPDREIFGGGRPAVPPISIGIGGRGGIGFGVGF